MQGRVLVIDDEPEILRAIKFYLEDEDFEVHTAEEPRTGLEIAETLQPDLILLDVMMPAMDGIQVCRQLRSRSRTRLIPVIFLTARENVEDKVRGLEAGGVDYITKPFNNQELLARIKAHIRRTQEEITSHPCTTLPGIHATEDEINSRLHEGKIFCTVFTHVEYLQEYREAYGVSRAERLLRYVADLLESVLEELAPERCFVGHPSYEEFVFLCPPESTSRVCAEIIRRFDEEKPRHYLEQHRQRGELTYYNYRGDLLRAPFMEIKMGGVCNANRFFATFASLAEWGAQALLKARARRGSTFFIEE